MRTGLIKLKWYDDDTNYDYPLHSKVRNICKLIELNWRERERDKKSELSVSDSRICNVGTIMYGGECKTLLHNMRSSGENSTASIQRKKTPPLKRKSLLCIGIGIRHTYIHTYKAPSLVFCLLSTKIVIVILLSFSSW